jgi:uncharacterized OsmC-like protein
MENQKQQSFDSGAKDSRRKPTESEQISLDLERVHNYEFRIRFGKGHYPELVTDEPQPIGNDRAPNASRLLAAAVGNCLSASLLYCAEKSRASVTALRAKVNVEHTRNQRGRLRIGKISVEIVPEVSEADRSKLERCVGLFEDFCVVTQSVREGIEISVDVKH